MPIKLFSPTPNHVRQQQFRERNPGYYGRLHAKRKAEVMVILAAKAQATVVAQREPLMLPAPMEELIFPGLEAKREKVVEVRERD